MRRPVQFALIAIIILLVGATAVSFMKYRQAYADYTRTKAAEEDARSRYADAFGAIAEIQDSLNAVIVGDSSLGLTSQGLREEQRLTGPNRQEALDRIALLNASIQRTKDKIHDLEARLHRSGLKMAGLEKMIANLKIDVASKEEQSAQLTAQVQSLQTQVVGLETTVQENQVTMAAKDETIEEKRREIGTIYYVVGTKKELAASGVIVAKGGVLGLGKTLAVSGNFNESLFKPLDTDQETVVRGTGAKPQVVSPQAPSSYELKLVGNEIELRILDPKEFRKVKHLVIVTA